MKGLLLWLVGVYQRVGSPLKRGPTCRYLPTCSEYAREAIQKHGAWRGFWKSVWRLLRCHPFAAHGYDPP